MILLVKLKAIKNLSKDYKGRIIDILNTSLDNNTFNCLKTVCNKERGKELAIIYISNYNEDIISKIYNSFDLNSYSIKIIKYTKEEFLNKQDFNYIDEEIYNLSDLDLIDIKEKISNLRRV